MTLCHLDAGILENVLFKAAIVKIKDGRFVVMFSLLYLVPLASLPMTMYV
jgi:hypothetical protein